jgi:hypothetical protein
MPTTRKTLSVRKGAGSSPQEGTALRTALGSVDFYLPFFHFMTIPKNTSQANYLSYVMSLPISQTERMWVEFPEGCKGLVGVQIWRATEQIFPLPAGVWLRSDRSTLNFRFSHVIDREPYEIEIRGYNVDDTYQHTPWIGLELHGLTREISAGLKSLIAAVENT